MYPKHHPRAQQQRRLRQHIHRSHAETFFNLLTCPELLGEVESLVPPHRKGVFSPTETLSMFLAQAISADRSCQNVVNDTAVKRMTRGLPQCSTHTGAYCRARQRVPTEMLTTLVRQTGRRLTAQAPAPWRWRGRPVRLVDGTTVVMPSTPANQAAYPQPRSQKPGLGFPCAGSSACCVSRVGQCSMPLSVAIRGKEAMSRPSSGRYSIHWSTEICSWAMPFTPHIFCCAPCVN